MAMQTRSIYIYELYTLIVLETINISIHLYGCLSPGGHQTLEQVSSWPSRYAKMTTNETPTLSFVLHI